MFREDIHTELKREITEDFKKEVVAFANTEGGTIYIGIDDDGTVTGIAETDKALAKITNMIRDTISPDLTMFVEYKIESLDNYDVIKIMVSSGVKKPYYIYSKGLKPNGVYVRQGTSAVPASEDHIKRMIKESDGDSYEKWEYRKLEMNVLQTYSID